MKKIIFGTFLLSCLNIYGFNIQIGAIDQGWKQTGMGGANFYEAIKVVNHNGSPILPAIECVARDIKTKTPLVMKWDIRVNYDSTPRYSINAMKLATADFMPRSAAYYYILVSPKLIKYRKGKVEAACHLYIPGIFPYN